MESMAYLVNTLLGAFIRKVLYHGEYGLVGQPHLVRLFVKCGPTMESMV